MDTWRSKALGDSMTACELAAQIETLFLRFYAAAGRPADMAVFTRSESEGRLHCEVIAYFSPAAAEIAQAYNAHACEKPARAELGLLAGDERAWRALFPEST